VSDDPADGGEKDAWDKLRLVLQSSGGILTALSVAVVGFLGSSVISENQNRNTDARLYSELMSQREQAESNLRKDMLVSVIQSYLQPEGGTVGARVLQLELLAYNFHDSLNLKPLFLDLARQLAPTDDPSHEPLLARLRQVAREISERQRFTLELRGDSFRRTVDLAELAANGRGGLALDPAVVSVDGVSTDVNLRILTADPVAQQLLVRLETQPTPPAQSAGATRAEFNVSFFDFPMIDSTRLENGQRCALILSNFGRETAEITTVCFPGEYASLKDRPYYDEVVRQLQLKE
jgi:hypothetical protein